MIGRTVPGRSRGRRAGWTGSGTSSTTCAPRCAGRSPSGEPEVGLRIVAAIWRYWQLSSQLAEGDRMGEPSSWPSRRPTGTRACGSRRCPPPQGSPTGHTTSRRLVPSTRSGSGWPRNSGDDPSIAEAHYEIGFMGMVDQDVEFLRHHETIALELFERARRRPTASSARGRRWSMQHFLKRRVREARALEVLDPRRIPADRVRATGSSTACALLSVASLLSGDVAAGRDYLDQSGRLTSAVLVRPDRRAGRSRAISALRIGSRGGRGAARRSRATDHARDRRDERRAPDPARPGPGRSRPRRQLGDGADGPIAEGRSMTLQDRSRPALGGSSPVD